MATRSTNSVEEILSTMLGQLGQAKAAVDGAQWIQQLVKIETVVAQCIQEMRAASQKAMEQTGVGDPGMPMGGQMGGPGGGGMPNAMPQQMGPMGPPGMPGMGGGPGIAGIRGSAPGAPDELRRILNAGPG